MYLATFVPLCLDMNLLLDLNEGLPKGINENLSLPNKHFLRETVVLYWLNLFMLFSPQ